MLKLFLFQPTPTIVLNLSLLFSGKLGPIFCGGEKGLVKKLWSWWLFSSEGICHNVFCEI